MRASAARIWVATFCNMSTNIDGGPPRNGRDRRSGSCVAAFGSIEQAPQVAGESRRVFTIASTSARAG